MAKEKPNLQYIKNNAAKMDTKLHLCRILYT